MFAKSFPVDNFNNKRNIDKIPEFAKAYICHYKPIEILCNSCKYIV